MYDDEFALYGNIFMLELDNIENMMQKIEIELSVNGFRPGVVYEKMSEFIEAYDQTTEKLSGHMEEIRERVKSQLPNIDLLQDPFEILIRLPLRMKILQNRYLDICNKSNFLSIEIKKLSIIQRDAQGGI